MSVSLTEAAVRDRSKTVTRRLGWLFAKPGDRVILCRKVMGRRQDEPLVRLAEVEVVDVRRERLSVISPSEVRREGFDWSPDQFVAFFTDHMGGDADQIVTRIEQALAPDRRRGPACASRGDVRPAGRHRPADRVA